MFCYSLVCKQAVLKEGHILLREWVLLHVVSSVAFGYLDKG